MKILNIITILMMTQTVFATVDRTNRNTISVGQGISSPGTTTPINLYDGFTYENSAAASYLKKPQLTGEYTMDSDPKIEYAGAEFGLGTSKSGVIVGYHKQMTCEGIESDLCDGLFGIKAGMNTEDYAVGIGYRSKSTYSLGVIFNPFSKSRFGITVDSRGETDRLEKMTAFGLGYSYESGNLIFALDASKKDTEGASSEANGVIKVTPGILYQSMSFSASMSYDVYVNDKDKIYDDNEKLTFGLGLRTEKLQLAIYRNFLYEADWSIALTKWF